MSQNNNKTEETTVDTCKYCDANLFEEKEEEENKIKPSYIIGISAIILAVGLYLNFFAGKKLFAEILFLAVAVISGYEIIPNGIKKLFQGKFNISFLITIAAAGAFIIGEGAEGAAVIFLFFIAEYLEDYAGERARRSVGALIKLTPQNAVVKRDGKNIELHAHAVDINEIVVVKPGDKIPLDGIVVNGTSSVNQAAITGESIPETKKEGDTVFAGTLNEEGYLEVRVTKKSNETVLSKIIALVKASQQKKSKTEAFIDRFSNYYTPAVIGLAIIVATVPPFIFGLNFDTWFYRALVLLVVSCPCALAMSTPVSIVSGITAGTNNGVLIKGGEYVEAMQKIKTMVFDKTGTLTEGKLEVTDIISLNNYSEKEILQIAGSLESKSKHPLAEAVIQCIEKSDMDLKEVDNFESITGKGVKGLINEKMFYIGKRSLFKGSPDLPDDLIRKHENEGKTIVIIGNDEHIIGLISLMDKIRPLSRSTIQELKESNIKTVMLTGDNEGTAKAVSSKIGIDNYYAGLLPEDKVRIINELLENGEQVAMVGDGVNDAPALAVSNVGIAMGTAGSDVAIETADIALMHDDISKVNYLINLSKKTMSVVKQNVSVSILVKGSFAFFAVLGFVSLWMAVAFGDMGLTLAVILNALRIGSAD
ncbi:heavy metal translocating P-type ATPase [Methanobacterium paludis]|uniref:Heavy metal translocating P-type ATPase n=1 Tax=Methanobacterium paludis (strain DSM 25820 / JCM 18151 / SWAN1) TaxID=868131 RepID=F6D6P8_METPW|nr:cation-translocating P-type ATPase [Methanobacterium paludis]AEG18331.1 heavy metal translocating P-type ATPase [Methanobacterium paludis]